MIKDKKNLFLLENKEGECEGHETEAVHEPVHIQGTVSQPLPVRESF
jgi:hypothetical protein